MTCPVPIIHLNAFFEGSDADRLRVAAEVRKALEDVGFLMISGHGVDAELIKRVERAGLAFFDRPEEQKQKYASGSKKANRGFGGLGTRTIGITENPDLLPSLQEAYGIGKLEVPDDPYFHTDFAKSIFTKNIWPDEPADFKPALSAYYEQMDRLFKKMMRVFAVALELPESYFDPFLDKHGSTLRLIHYPALEYEPRPGELRSGAHTDTGTMTILHIDDTPSALQVLTRSGEWLDLNKVEGAFIINIGDLMMQWTNDKWMSNTHRVANPPIVNGRSDRRLSIVYFCQMNYDTLVECLPNCCGPDNPPKYEPIRSGEYSAMRAAQRYRL